MRRVEKAKTMSELTFFSFLAFSLIRLILRTLYPYVNDDGTFGSKYESKNETLDISFAIVLGNVLGSAILFTLFMLIGNWLVSTLH